MLPKCSRGGRAELGMLMKTGTRFHGRLFTYIYRKDTKPIANVVVSKKVSPTSVRRNLVRRRAYEALRHHPIPFGVVLIAKQGTDTATYHAMLDDIAQFKNRTV